MDKLIYSIYKLTNIKNQKCYIGYTSKEPLIRYQQHISDSITRCNYPIHKAIRKYGKDNFIFEVIYQSKDKEHTLNIMEPFFIQIFKSLKEGYNCSLGGEATFFGRKHTSETREKMSKSHIGKYHPSYSRSRELNPFFGKKHTTNSLEKMSGPRPNIIGENNPNIKSRQQYSITFENGTVRIIQGINKFCKDNGYTRSLLYKVEKKLVNRHKDIVAVNKIILL